MSGAANVRGASAPHSSTERDAADDTTKGSFKLTLLETVAADPQMKPADLSVMLAYCSQLQWPKRVAWVSGSLARAKTGLSERQINVSRTRLVARGYLVARGKQGLNRLFEIVNDRAADMQLHVRESTEYFRGQVKERQASRRAVLRAVTANSAPTDQGMSQHPGDCDVTANNAGNIPSYTPQNIALRGSNHSQPFPVPATEDEAIDLVATLLEGQSHHVSLVLFDTLRERLAAGNLSQDDVDLLLTKVAMVA